VLPLALLVSLLYALGKLHRANELTAMRAAGVGFVRMTAPIWVVGVLCCGLTWWLNTTVVPWSIERKSEMDDSLHFAATRPRASPSTGAAPFTAWLSTTPSRAGMWFFNRYKQDHRPRVRRVVSNRPAAARNPAGARGRGVAR